MAVNTKFIIDFITGSFVELYQLEVLGPVSLLQRDNTVGTWQKLKWVTNNPPNINSDVQKERA